MTLEGLFKIVSASQDIALHGDCICTFIKSDADTLGVVLSNEMLASEVTDIQADKDVLKVWVKNSHLDM